MSDNFDIAVVGATGVVGEALLEILSARNFPVGKVYALASERSVGKKVDFGLGHSILMISLHSIFRRFK
jgi:aspartate-semialdehyde dehydrogenase